MANYKRTRKTYRRKGTKSKKTQVSKNTRAIARLKSTQYRKCTYVDSLSQGPYDPSTGHGTSIPPLLGGQLISPSDWVPVWGSQPNPDPSALTQKTSHPNVFLVDHVNLRLNLRLGGPNIGNGEQPIHYAFFVFKIKKGYREQTKDRLLSQGGGIHGAYIAGLDYTAQKQGASFPNSEAMWEMNSDIYDVMATKRGRVGVWPAPLPLSTTTGQNYSFVTTGNMDDCNKDYVMRLPFKNKLEYGVGFLQPDPTDPQQMPIRTSWKTLNAQTVDDSDQIYWLLFHDSLHPTASPLSMSMSLQVKGREPQ